MPESTPLIDFSEFNIDHVVADRAALEQQIPQRFEMSQLDGVLFEAEDPLRAVGYKHITEDEFWIRGHMPEFPLMPGVMMCESAAQLIAYLSGRYELRDDEGIIGFGGMNNVKFRNMVVPGDTLIVMARVSKLRKNSMVVSDFQGWVNQKPVVAGELRGVMLPAGALQRES